jgi:hypothetical protein
MAGIGDDFMRNEVLRQALERKLKVYMCNYDGVMNRLVAAKSMRQASILTDVSYRHFLAYGHETFNEISCKLALASPGTVYEAKCTSNGWQPVKGKK